eukprot:9932952-Lingulodinium_polyedra.AAC.1
MLFLGAVRAPADQVWHTLVGVDAARGALVHSLGRAQQHGVFGRVELQGVGQQQAEPVGEVPVFA